MTDPYFRCFWTRCQMKSLRILLFRLVRQPDVVDIYYAKPEHSLITTCTR